MKLELIRTPKARAALSANFLKRAVQDFSNVIAHDDWAVSTIQILRRIPNAKHYMSNRQSRYVF